MSSISPERWAKVEAILDELLEVPASERPARLDRLAAGDPELRREVESMLDEDGHSRGPLDSSVNDVAARLLTDGAPKTHSAWAGRRIGPYRVIRELGRGGMGEVLLAERADGQFEHRVAIKIVRSEAREGIAERFRHERSILARLRHPNIASIYDGGSTEGGLPYFAMELVEGARITTYCEEHKLDVDARLALFEFVCHAVQHAHRNLVIHRDLKPSNVLVTSDGMVKLLDFGIAKVIDPEDSGETTTQVFLTPAYASPEQVQGLPTSTATDVYALGVLLYEILVGKNPHGETSRSRSAGLARAIVEEDPRPPSEVAKEPVRRRLRGDLDNILERALRKKPEERYPSVEDFREDLERHRKSLPVMARPATLHYRVRKFVRRHRLGAAAGVAIGLSLLFGAAGIVWQSRVAARERDRAREEAKRASAVKDYLLEVFSAVNPMYESGESLTALELAERGAAQLTNRFESDPVIRAEIAQTLGKVMMSLASYERADTLLSAALEQHRRSNDSERVVQTLLDLGEVARWRAELDEAGRLMEEAVATANAELPPENPWVARSYGSLAVVLAFQDRYDEAEAASREGIRLTREVNGPGSLIEGEHLSNLAMIMKEKGELVRAEALLREAVEIYRARGAAENELTMSGILASHGDTLDDLDRLEEAEAASREAIAILEREYGEEGHPDLAVALSNLGGTVRRLGRLEEAEAIQLRALEIFKRHLGEEHYFVARLYSNLSVTRMDMDDFAGAEKLQADALRLMKKQLGERHSSLLGPMNNRGNVLSDLGREAESEAQYRESLSIAVETFGEKSLQASYPLLGLASVLRKTGRLEESERYARESWEIRKGVVGSGHSLELSARVSVAATLRLRGRTSEARELLDSAVADARAGLPATQGVLTRAEAELAKLTES